MTYSHRKITKFGLEGEIFDDAKIPKIKDQYINMIYNGMRNKGYVPRYDIDPDFTTSYNGKTFEFKLSVYGVYVGKKKAKCVKGIDKNQVITSTTTQNLKSEEVF
jgi:hypothetical protein